MQPNPQGTMANELYIIHCYQQEFGIANSISDIVKLRLIFSNKNKHCMYIIAHPIDLPLNAHETKY